MGGENQITQQLTQELQILAGAAVVEAGIIVLVRQGLQVWLL
jgi:hypothetical protein